MPTDLRRKSAPAPAPAATPTPRAPMPVGTAINLSRLTEFERKQLGQLGLKEGDAVPGNLADVIAAARADADDTTRFPVALSTPPLKVEPVELSDLKAADRERVEKAIQEAREQAILLRDHPNLAEAGPGVNEAIETGRQAQIEMVIEPRPAKPSPVPETPTNAAVDATSDRTGLAEKHCQHCGWDTQRPDPTEPTIPEKREFLQAVLGDTRFQKTYVLLDGALSVTFRTLTSREGELALKQIGADTLNKTITGGGEWLEKLTLYRMAMSLASLQTRSGTKTVDVYHDFECEHAKNETALPQILDWILENVLPSESIKRKVGQMFMEFQRLCEKLEARIDDANFWKGIE